LSEYRREVQKAGLTEFLAERWQIVSWAWKPENQRAHRGATARG
jgi:hypothetical protein